MSNIEDFIASAILEEYSEPLKEELNSYIDKLISDVWASDLCHINKVVLVMSLTQIKKGWDEVKKTLKEDVSPLEDKEEK